jgi:glycosyltransferase involved in cell wall biosynthesis
MVAPQPFFRPRGTPFSVLHRIRALRKLGHSVELITYPFGEAPDLPGVVLHRTARPPWVRDVIIGPSAAKLWLDVPLFSKMAALLRRERFELLHTHEEAGLLGAMLAPSHGIPHLYDMHSSLPQQFSNFERFNWGPIVAAFRWMERYTLEHADGVIAICPDLRDHVLTSGYQGPLELIENTLDYEPPEIRPEQTRALRERLDVAEGRVILYTGTLEPYQGLDLLVQAAPAVSAQAPDARFVIVGGTTSQITALRRLAIELGVDERFRWVPAVPPLEVFEYLRLADVLITTRARGTNTPLKIYQYLRAGKPIVATDIRSHTQVLDAASAELVAPFHDQIAAGLLRVLGDEDRARSLARSAARLASERYSEETYIETLRRLLARISGGSATRRETQSCVV